MPTRRKSTKQNTLTETSKKSEGELAEDELKSVIGGAAVGGAPANTPMKINFPKATPVSRSLSAACTTARAEGSGTQARDRRRGG
jgi:hypothetical protein